MANYSKDFLAQLYRTLYTIRVFEAQGVRLYRQGLIRGYFHPYTGQEAIAAGVCAALADRDYVLSTHRGHGHCIARGADLHRMVAELLGRSTGYCRGLGGSMHIADLSKGNLGANGIVGANVPLGVGAALGAKLRGEDRVSVVFTSDGGANNGVFFEALNLAAVWNLPALIVIENNQYAVSTPIHESTRETDLYKRGIGLGVESRRLNGNDVLEVYEHACGAVARCREGRGPVLLEAVTYRHGGHHVNDPGLYMPKDRMEYYRARDPVAIGRDYLADLGGATDEEIRAIEAAVEHELESAVAFAKSSPVLSTDEFLALIEGY
ncbi:MAG: thiamine pyrophosphate-dependent dehydrogenase E1 component subunit alpha [Candidatus Sumerlaeia bacterium]|nr:thiamine pyrophosphate-dependent dehydrogenase E1 component subunit alpha [Candidatus Sumerlaeia bacterium]